MSGTATGSIASSPPGDVGLMLVMGFAEPRVLRMIAW
jgi:hypothetical protein